MRLYMLIYLSFVIPERNIRRRKDFTSLVDVLRYTFLIFHPDKTIYNIFLLFCLFHKAQGHKAESTPVSLINRYSEIHTMVTQFQYHFFIDPRTDTVYRYTESNQNRPSSL